LSPAGPCAKLPTKPNSSQRVLPSPAPLRERPEVTAILRKKLLPILIAAALGVAAYFLPLEGLSEAGSAALAIFMIAAVLWITEAVPLYVTSLIIVVLECVWLVGSAGPGGEIITDYKQFLHPFFSSVVALFLGGFILARAVHKYRIDERIAKAILDRVGTNPRIVLLAMMITTAFFSMWMSNTATTALMITVALPVLKETEKGDPFRKALMLGIPFAANIGGMGTPIGTPPNAIAIGGLQEAGFSIGFGQWMGFAVPILIVALIVTWLLLGLFFKPKTQHFKVDIEIKRKMGPKGRFILYVLVGTVIAWLAQPLWKDVLPGFTTSIIALIPGVLFLATGILDKDDFNSLGWNILFIMGGGLSLGVALSQSGLNSYLVGLISLEGLPFLLILVIFGLLAATMTTFISNTATASLLIPIVVGFTGMGYEMLAFVAPLAVMVALSSSVSMVLPISTPPNAIAYGSGELKVKDMAKSGLVITLVCIVIILAFKFLIGLILA
jgi:sodium-dependent dicarboxylate transporter 2/3/5